MIARPPQDLTALTSVAVMAGGSSITMLPKPMYTGGGPLWRNASRSGGGVKSGGERKKKPQTLRCAGQSAGLGINVGDQQYVKGIFKVSAKRGPSVTDIGSRSMVFLQSLITSPRLL